MKFPINVSPVAPPEFVKRTFFYADGAAKNLIRNPPYTMLLSAGDNVMLKMASEANGFSAGGTDYGLYLAQYTISDLSENWAKVITDVAGAGEKGTQDTKSMSVSPYDNALTATFYRPDDGSFDMKIIFTDATGAISYAVDLDESTMGAPYSPADQCSLLFQSNGDLWIVGPHTEEEGIIPTSVRRFEYFTNVYYLTRASSYLTAAGFKTIGERVDIADGTTETNLGTFHSVGSTAAAVDPADDSLVMFGYECFQANDGIPETEYFWPCMVRVTRGGTITSTRVIHSSFTPNTHSNWSLYAWDITIDSDSNIYVWWRHSELISPFRGGTYVSKFNSSFVHQWSRVANNFTLAVQQRSKLLLSPDGSNLYVSYGSNFNTLDVQIFDKATGEHIDHCVVSGINENDYTYQLLYPKIHCTSSRVIFGGIMNTGFFRSGVVLVNTNQYDFERGGTFDNIRVLYDRWNANVGDNQGRSRDTTRWSASNDITTATSYVGEYSYGGGLGASVTVTDASSDMQIASVTETPTETFIQR